MLTSGRYQRRIAAEEILDTISLNPDINSSTDRPPEIQKVVLVRRPNKPSRRRSVWSGLCVKGQHTMAESPEVMNIRQASEYLGVSPDTLYKYVSEERIPAFKLGNRWKFKKTILDSWMERKSSVGEGRDKKKPKSAKAAAGGQ